MGRHQQPHQKQTYTNKQSGSKLEGGKKREEEKEEEKGEILYRSGMFSCSHAPQTGAISPR